MTFLEAQRALSNFTSGPELPFLLGMSGSATPLDLYLKAHAATKGYGAQQRILPFGTLVQSIYSPPVADESEVWVLFPWDLAPECDWRSGIVENFTTMEMVLGKAEKLLHQLSKRTLALITYISAPIPPVFSIQAKNDELASNLQVLAAKFGAIAIAADTFSLSSYLSNGCPFGGSKLSEIANSIIDLLLMPLPGSGKVLVTDLDETLWSGLIGEDGPEGISAAPEGKAFPHFIYQTMLKKLKNSGVLLAVASRNDPQVAQQPLLNGTMVLHHSDFVAFKAGYGSKSEYISAISSELNLGLDSFVFIDDNHVELAEVGSQLPPVICLPFPKHESGLPELLKQLSTIFERNNILDEDSSRTELYRRRIASIPPPSTGDGNQLREFLEELSMVLTIRQRPQEDCQRALQLINKTNQFNLNGVRLDMAQLESHMNAGCNLYTATLEDRTGNHGEIIACLIDSQGKILHWVMSCRIFQRKVEHAFVSWLAIAWKDTPLTFSFVETERNEPIKLFLTDPAFASTPDDRKLDSQAFMDQHAEDIRIVKIQENFTP